MRLVWLAWLGFGVGLGCSDGEPAPYTVEAERGDQGDGGSDVPADAGTRATADAGRTGTRGWDAGDVPDFVDSDRSLAELSPGEVRRVCDDVAAEIEDAIGLDTFAEFSCTLIALLVLDESSSIADCERAVTTCITEGEVSGDGFACDLDPTLAQGCQASVAQFEDCSAEMAEAVLVLFDTLSCPNLLSDAGAAPVPPDMPACDALQTQCPELFGDGRGGL